MKTQEGSWTSFTKSGCLPENKICLPVVPPTAVAVRLGGATQEPEGSRASSRSLVLYQTTNFVWPSFRSWPWPYVSEGQLQEPGRILDLFTKSGCLPENKICLPVVPFTAVPYVSEGQLEQPGRILDL